MHEQVVDERIHGISGHCDRLYRPGCSENRERSLADADPDRYFLPPYMGQHGWIGVWLDAGAVDWHEIEAFLVDAYRLMAPKSLTRDLSATPPGR